MLVSPPLTGALLPADLLATDWLMVDDDADDAGVGLVVGRFLPLEAPPASILCVCVFFFPFFQTLSISSPNFEEEENTDE